jgi:hypothetical protein
MAHAIEQGGRESRQAVTAEKRSAHLSRDKEVQTTRTCKCASENDSYATNSQPNTCCCTALSRAGMAAVAAGWWWEERLEMETVQATQRGAMGFFLPAPFAVDWRLFAACAWRERQTNRTNRGRDRNWDAVH